jgi:hypothetical protein
MSAALLHRVGEALYGPLWQSEMARALAVNDRTVRRWAAGTHSPPPRVWADIARLAFERRNALSRLLQEVAAQSEGLAVLHEAP